MELSQRVGLPQQDFGFEVTGVLLKKKNGKTIYAFSFVKFMFITCDK